MIVNLAAARTYVLVLRRGSLPGTVKMVEWLDLDPRSNLPLWLICQLTHSGRRFSRVILSIVA